MKRSRFAVRSSRNVKRKGSSSAALRAKELESARVPLLLRTISLSPLTGRKKQLVTLDKLVHAGRRRKCVRRILLAPIDKLEALSQHVARLRDNRLLVAHELLQLLHLLLQHCIRESFVSALPEKCRES